MSRLVKQVKELLEAVDPRVTVIESTDDSELPAPECVQSLDFNADESPADLHSQLARKRELSKIMRAHPNYFENQDQADALNLEIVQLERLIEEAEG